MYSEKVLKKILADVHKGKLSEEKAFDRLKSLPYESLSCAKLDHHRSLRHAMPEVVFAPGKSFAQLVEIVAAFIKRDHPVLITRLEYEVYVKLRKKFPFLVYSDHGKIAHSKIIKRKKKNESTSTVAVITAGTSDIPVAEEASVTLEMMERRVARFYDVGVAGLHRLIDVLPELQKVDVVICIAGMEGALASVVAGLVNVPIVAVPTSVGYGASFQGLAPLLTMLNSCAPGVAVVNIDNGFGAACFAKMITETK